MDEEYGIGVGAMDAALMEAQARELASLATTDDYAAWTEDAPAWPYVGAGIVVALCVYGAFRFAEDVLSWWWGA